ncbi:MAG: hypothetical protein KGZ83_00035 [Sulfuricella sp.]|nr:hypothetical protein [Sulfuricella sp.]
MQNILAGINEKMLWHSIKESPRLTAFLSTPPLQDRLTDHDRLDIAEADVLPKTEEFNPENSPARSSDQSAEEQKPTSPLPETTLSTDATRNIPFPDTTSVASAMLSSISQETPPEIVPAPPLKMEPNIAQELVMPSLTVCAEQDHDASSKKALPPSLPTAAEMSIIPPELPTLPAFLTEQDAQAEEPLTPAAMPQEVAAAFDLAGPGSPEFAPLDERHVDQQPPHAISDTTPSETVPGNALEASVPITPAKKPSVASRHGFSNDKRTQSKTNLVLGIAALLAVLVLLISILITWPTISHVLGFRGSRPATISTPPSQPEVAAPTAVPPASQEEPASQSNLAPGTTSSPETGAGEMTLTPNQSNGIDEEKK